MVKEQSTFGSCSSWCITMLQNKGEHHICVILCSDGTALWHDIDTDRVIWIEEDSDHLFVNAISCLQSLRTWFIFPQPDDVRLSRFVSKEWNPKHIPVTISENRFGPLGSNMSIKSMHVSTLHFLIILQDMRDPSGTLILQCQFFMKNGVNTSITHSKFQWKKLNGQ